MRLPLTAYINKFHFRIAWSSHTLPYFINEIIAEKVTNPNFESIAFCPIKAGKYHLMPPRGR